MKRVHGLAPGTPFPKIVVVIVSETLLYANASAPSPNTSLVASATFGGPASRLARLFLSHEAHARASSIRAIWKHQMSDIQNNTAKLTEYDFVIVIDKSGSMAEPVKAGSSITRWQAVQESAMTVIRDVEKLDADGLGLVLFSGSGISAHDGVTSDKFREVFAQNSPRGSPPLAEALTEALKLWPASLTKRTSSSCSLTACQTTSMPPPRSSLTRPTAKRQTMP
jgi:hypothetical protein